MTWILLVDDDAAVRRVLRRDLTACGAEVLDFGDSDQALKAFDEDPTSFRGAFLDVRMPGRTGIELAAALRELSPFLRVAFVAAVTSDLLDAPSRLRPFLVISKPWKRHELAAALEDMPFG